MRWRVLAARRPRLRCRISGRTANFDDSIKTTLLGRFRVVKRAVPASQVRRRFGFLRRLSRRRDFPLAFGGPRDRTSLANLDGRSHDQTFQLSPMASTAVSVCSGGE